MNLRTYRAHVAGLGIPVLLAILIGVTAAAPAFAADSNGEVKLSSTATSDHELVRTGSSSAIELWQRSGSLVARRTTDAGVHWLPAQTLATKVGLGSSIAASGAQVDLVYVQSVTCPSSGGRVSRLYHRRSQNGGATWSTPVALTSSCSDVVQPDVARSADGQVSVAWNGLQTGRILVRTSRDGGATFGPAIAAAATANWDTDVSQGSHRLYYADVQIAIGGSGTTYLGYASAHDTLSIRRSLNRGTSWSAATILTTTAFEPDVSIAATAGRAAIAYTVAKPAPIRAVIRSTDDRGASWSTARSIVVVARGQFSAQPQLAADVGALSVIVKFGTPGNSPIWLRRSTTFGNTWSASVRVSSAHGPRMDPETAGVAMLGSVVLSGYAENGDVTGLWVRSTAR